MQLLIEKSWIKKRKIEDLKFNLIPVYPKLIKEGKVDYRKVKFLRNYDANKKMNGGWQKEAFLLRESIKNNGLDKTKPLIINWNSVIIDGHHRSICAYELGHREVYTIKRNKYIAGYILGVLTLLYTKIFKGK